MPKYVDPDIFTTNNKYGYIFNINHRDIAPYYEDFKKRHGLPNHFPISDLKRRCFEYGLSKRIELGEIIIKKRGRK